MKKEKKVKQEKKAKSRTSSRNSRLSSDDIRRLYRSEDDKFVAGVCAGIAEYFTLDPIWIRLITIILVFLEGIGILMSVVLWMLLPKNPKRGQSKRTVFEQKVSSFSKRIRSKHNKNPLYDVYEQDAIREFTEAKKGGSGHLYVGVFLLVLGFLFFFKNFFGWFNLGVFWSVLIITLGLIIFLKRGD